MKKLAKITVFSTLIVLCLCGTAFAGALPDTGQTKCYNDTAEIPCPAPGEDFYGQDAQYVTNLRSYTKLDAGGNDLPDSAASWTMVRDNVTGLIWEVKTDDGSVHDKDNTYTWDDAQSVFIPELNSANFGGYSDWCLPTIKELASVANLEQSNPTIDTGYFPNSKLSRYWSSSTNTGVFTRAGGIHPGRGKFCEQYKCHCPTGRG